MHTGFCGRLEEKRSRGRSSRRWEDLQEVEYGAWLGLNRLRIGRVGEILCMPY